MKESGKKIKRPQLDELLKILRKGDTVIVYKLERISRADDELMKYLYPLFI
ncbi:recombinase family protein [Alkalihalobacillus pseudalcaliphilus]|uniref:recombinase family protein n=1 Tax=Alkalihalobacillus pseudalcaliphilus TaxID=79884 RepID=UPI0009FEF43C|nr:recombinase family protein [Alkalihalobacillus pseudalcaliphilus]